MLFRSVSQSRYKLKEEWQSEINKTLHIKYTPKLHFKFDEAQKRGDRILQIMSELGPPAEDKP